MKPQIKICYIATIHRTLNAFVLKTAQFIHENTDWDISFICNDDREWADSLPEYFHYFPVDMNRGLSFSFKTERQIYNILKKEQFDLVQFCTPNASLYTALAAARAKVPVRLYCQWGIAYVGFAGWKRKILKLEEKFVCSRATVIEPDSSSNLHFAFAEGLYKKEKGHVIWNGSACGVDLNKYDISNREAYRRKIREGLGIPKDAFVFGFVGRINKDKGITELFRSFKMMQETSKDSYLILVGRDERSDDADNNLNQWADKNDRIIFTGFSDKVEQYMSAMDCYVLPSYREGFGLSVVEAEAMGLPVIVTDIPGPIDAMEEGKTGIVIPKKDTEALYHAMTILYEDENKRAEYGSAGPRFAKERFEQQELFRRILEDRIELLDQAANR
ncbi:MAG: glycosyltransferase [Aeriscardovia sp.]|nr:glycosyltransferase [Aeriscardovia sp.]